MLSYTDPAVTVAEADTYATDRAWTEWTGSNEAKTAALRRGQDYVAGLYNSRWNVAFDDADVPDAVKFAIIEAARRELVKPGSLNPDYVGSAIVARKREKVEGIEREVEYRAGSDAASARPEIAIIGQLLAGLVAASTSSVNWLMRA